MERNTVFANFARSRELEILIDSLAEAYNCGIAGANKPWKIAYRTINNQI